MHTRNPHNSSKMKCISTYIYIYILFQNPSFVDAFLFWLHRSDSTSPRLSFVFASISSSRKMRCKLRDLRQRRFVPPVLKMIKMDGRWVVDGGKGCKILKWWHLRVFVGVFFCCFFWNFTPLRRVTNRLSSRGRGSTNILGEYPAEWFFAGNGQQPVLLKHPWSTLYLGWSPAVTTRMDQPFKPIWRFQPFSFTFICWAVIKKKLTLPISQQYLSMFLEKMR